MGTPIWGDRPPLVYYAEPIDKAAGRNFTIASHIVSCLTTWGCTIYRPSTAWRTRQPDPRVEQINRHALYQADAIVAYLDEHTPSIGVPAEIEAATARGIPAVVHYTGQSFALAGNPLVTVIDTPAGLISALEHALKEHPRDGRTIAVVSPTYRIPFSPEELAEQQQASTAVDRFARGLNADPIRLVVTDGAQPPTRAYADDAGIDLTTARETTIEPGQYVDIHTQVEGTQLPAGFWGLITGRSSALRKWRLHIPVAIIDPGWRGPLFVGVWNLGGNPVTVKPGDRLGQLILVPNNPAQVAVVQQLDPHPRGLKGFGSSG